MFGGIKGLNLTQEMKFPTHCLSCVQPSSRLLWITFCLSPFPNRLLCQIVTLNVHYMFANDKGIDGDCSSFWWQWSCCWRTMPLIRLYFLSTPAQSSLLCSYRACHRTREKEKEGEVGGVLRARRGVFLYALLLERKPISSVSWWVKKLRSSLSMYIICARGGS